MQTRQRKKECSHRRRAHFRSRPKQTTYVFDSLVDLNHASKAVLLTPGHHVDELLVLLLLLGVVALRLLFVHLDLAGVEFLSVDLRNERKKW